MENYYPHSQPRHRIHPLILVLGIALISSTALLIATCGKPGVMTSGSETDNAVLENVGYRLQKVLGRSVTIHSDGVVTFPNETVEVVLENHLIQSTTRYQSVGWLGKGDSHVVMSGTYRARVGFDFSGASAQVEDGTLRLWLPRPRILAMETMKVGRQGEDVSWFNPLEPCEMEAAYRANRAEAERQLDEAKLLQGASERLTRRVREDLEALGIPVRVGMLPDPAV